MFCKNAPPPSRMNSKPLSDDLRPCPGRSSLQPVDHRYLGVLSKLLAPRQGIRQSEVQATVQDPATAGALSGKHADANRPMCTSYSGTSRLSGNIPPMPG